MPTSKRSGEKRGSLKASKGKRVKPLLKRSGAPSTMAFVMPVTPWQHRAKPRPDRQIDPDDAPELTEEFFERADVYEGDKLIRAGRPRSENPKMALKLRIDPDVVEHFRATGPGWQTRINDTLRKAAKLPAKHSRSR
jgi:uncharacterized protein (DUF4415 family)